MDKLYKHRTPWELEPYYSAHISAMTSEGLHSKADIAAELAYRDMIIAEQNKRIEQLARLHQML